MGNYPLSSTMQDHHAGPSLITMCDEYIIRICTMWLRRFQTSSSKYRASRDTVMARGGMLNKVVGWEVSGSTITAVLWSVLEQNARHPRCCQSSFVTNYLNSCWSRWFAPPDPTIISDNLCLLDGEGT